MRSATPRTTPNVAPKERPILFKGEMVRAILDGRKTQTRRLIKPQPTVSLEGTVNWSNKGRSLAGGALDRLIDFCPCPYGQPGDRLWVRETFRSMHVDKSPGPVVYKADHPEAKTVPGTYGQAWKPSIHMPRWASRITLEITDVRVERLQDISGRDAASEGCQLEQWITGQYPNFDPGVEADNQTLIKKFRNLWQSINGPESWDANPWVWVVSFRRAES